MKRFITYSHRKMAFVSGSIALAFMYLTIWVSSFPDKQGFTWQIVFGLNTGFAVIITCFLAGFALDEWDTKKRNAQRSRY